MHKLNKLDRTTHLLPGEPQTRSDRDRAYMMSMSDENLLRAHHPEAGLIRMVGKPEGIFWGWESPLNDLRGNLIGHWLSAAFWRTGMEVCINGEPIVCQRGASALR